VDAYRTATRLQIGFILVLIPICAAARTCLSSLPWWHVESATNMQIGYMTGQPPRGPATRPKLIRLVDRCARSTSRPTRCLGAKATKGRTNTACMTATKI